MRAYKFISAQWARQAIFQRRLKLSLLNDLNDPWDGHGVKFNRPEDELAWKKSMGQLAQTNGILCLSLDWRDPVLWSHYADQHRGIAMGFEANDDYVQLVNYQSDLLEFEDIYGLSDGGKLDFVRRAYSTKYTNWRYEKEARLFAKLDEPDLITGHFFKNFDKNMFLREVIFGMRYQNSEEMAVILSHVRKDPNVNCWKAGMGKQTFEMEVDKDWNYSRPT